MVKVALFIFLLLLQLSAFAVGKDSFSVSLNGRWLAGERNGKMEEVTVPGIAFDPTKMPAGKVWYKRYVQMPKGNWTAAMLELKGARFLPEVFINGQSMGRQNGGMGPTFHPLQSLHPGQTVLMEIALTSLKEVPQTDASFIPAADQWRSNISSCIWDDVVLHLYKEVMIKRVMPEIEFNQKRVTIHYDLEANDPGFNGLAKAEVLDANEHVLLSVIRPATIANNRIIIDYENKLQEWSPEMPVVYKLKLSMIDKNGQVLHATTTTLGIKKFAVQNKQFMLNNKPCLLRGGTVVWHRWVRSKEGRELAYDTAWFRKNIVQRLKGLGANYLRFHLGLPPERFLDLCDQYGLCVQFEWSFFHGMPASAESLKEQYRNWLDVAMRHPSVCIVHPYNETQENELKLVWTTLDELLKNYPPLVLEDRDVMHLHKYWWGLFENVGVYYDSFAQFSKAIMVDEFGGNYLDENGNIGGYTTLKEGFLRFLGRNQTAAERLAFQAMSGSRVAEYWRRIGAAGFAPFCMLGSYEDGNHWFLGKLSEGNPKPMWGALAAAFSPVSVSLDIWDKNFQPSQKISVPVYFFNDGHKTFSLKVKIGITDEKGQPVFDTIVLLTVPAGTKYIRNIPLTIPANSGSYLLKAELLNKPARVTQPVVSGWRFEVLKAKVPGIVRTVTIGIPEGEKELLQFAKNNQLKTTAFSDTTANVLLASLQTWKNLASGDQQIRETIQNAINKGISVVLLDVGKRELGQGYPANKTDLGPLQGEVKIKEPRVDSYELTHGVKIICKEAAEPESYLHAPLEDTSLWYHLDKENAWLWNGLRGGLNVPASDMGFSGLSPEAFKAQWAGRGADSMLIGSSPCYAYELQGFYAFARTANDTAALNMLRKKVAFLAEDAPSLANALSPASAIKVTDLLTEYTMAATGQAQRFTALAECGKNLTRKPVVQIDFGKGKGMLVVSQLLTSNRLAPEFSEPGFYGTRYDEAAVQMVLNMLAIALHKQE